MSQRSLNIYKIINSGELFGRDNEECSINTNGIRV